MKNNPIICPLAETADGSIFYSVNLTFPTEIETNWSLRRIFEKSRVPYRLLYKNDFVLFSPESFVRIADYLEKQLIIPEIIRPCDLPKYEEARLINAMRSLEEAEPILIPEIN